MESRDYLELSFRSINCFANDGRLDADELRELLAIAKRDGNIDDNEKRVLAAIMAKVREEEIDKELLQAMEEVEKVI
ncbi:hypothetical protein P886_4109 [Alteromonadaceae bacterium 2753L.S.0a.02]|nr:hypothetical protein P886_4109 [Alteromonadaceae bacterium 2753L.S.0a.02]